MYITMLLWLFIILLLIILFKLLNINKNYFISIVISLSIILFLLNLEVSIQAAIVGLNLVIKTILPTIFPFSVICNLLISFDGITLYSKILGPLICKPLKLSRKCSFPLAASIISGYPLGCKYSCDLYELGYINKLQFERLLSIASNASPMFLIGAIGATMFGRPYYGYILLIANYVSPLIVGFLTMPKTKEYYIVNDKSFNTSTSKINLGTALKLAIENGLNTTLMVGGFVILFSIIISIIKNNAIIGIALNFIEKFLSLPKTSLYGIFVGSIEFTNGCKLISLASLPITLKLSIISFICSFSGLSVIAQISSIVSKYNVNMKKYIFWKLLQGIISFIITLISSYLLINTHIVSTFPTSIIYIDNKILFFLYVLLIIPLFISIFIHYYKRLHIS